MIYVNDIFRVTSKSLLPKGRFKLLGQMAGLQSTSENHCNGMGEKVCMDNCYERC